MVAIAVVEPQLPFGREPLVGRKESRFASNGPGRPINQDEVQEPVELRVVELVDATVGTCHGKGVG